MHAYLTCPHTCACGPTHALQALAIYKELLQMDDMDPLYYVYAAACHFYMGMYKEAEEMALQVRARAHARAAL